MYNIEKRGIKPGDEEYIACIRRSNLDAITGKSQLTISSHRREMFANIARCERAQKTPSYPHRGPMPMEDTVGMSVLVEMQMKSLHARGRIKDYVQFDTLRRLRSSYTKAYDSSPLAVGEGASFSQGTGRVRPTSCPTQSEFFTDAIRGMENRLGYDTHADHAVSIEAIVKCLHLIKEDAAELALDAETLPEANQLFKLGAFICVLTAGGLRGYEGFYTDLAGLRQHLHKGKDGVIPDKVKNCNNLLSEEECKNLPHVVLPLLGNFKNRPGTALHLINLASKSMSGLETRWWIEKLVEVAKLEGRVSGPAFATPEGELDDSTNYDAGLRKYIKIVQETTTLIDDDIDVVLWYSTNRTPRKTALTRAKRAGIGGDMQDEMNRWRNVENAKGKRVRFNMRMLYSEACLLMPVTWRYSYAQ